MGCLTQRGRCQLIILSNSSDSVFPIAMNNDLLRNSKKVLSLTLGRKILCLPDVVHNLQEVCLHSLR